MAEQSSDDFRKRACDFVEQYKLQKHTGDIRKSHVGTQVHVTGWIENIRYSKKIIFFELRGGATPNDIVECVGKRELCVCDGKDFSKETYVELLCTVAKVPEKHHSKKGFELKVDKVIDVTPSDTDFSGRVPKDAGPHVKLVERHLYVRDQKMRLYAKLNDLTLRALRKTFHALKCTEIIPALFGSVKCEGGSDIFEMDHMGEKAFLTQSSQMYLEAAVPAVDNCYCIQPSFRKEKSATRRHLSCFTHVEAEISGVRKFDDWITYLQGFVIVFFTILMEEDDEGILEALDRKSFIEEWSQKDMLVLEHKDAIKLLQEYGITKKDGTFYEEHDDIKEAEERQLIDKIDKIVFLTKFPLMSKAFYSKTDVDDPTRAACVDVEFPGVGEIIGSAVREDDYETLKQKLQLFTLRDVASEMIEKLDQFLTEGKDPDLMREQKERIQKDILAMDAKKLGDDLLICLEYVDYFTRDEVDKFTKDITEIPYDNYDWYFDLRKYGAGRTAGFGLGLERLVTWIAGAHSVKDTTMFPRFMGYLKP